ncbi:MAG: hypothetical protein H6697_12185 [Myxococcales bacterium]|nr:hypothetical protein [Myxococcales bacterium]MCB9520872.1 hypothetical protein [Myxococcales bacterium]
MNNAKTVARIALGLLLLLMPLWLPTIIWTLQKPSDRHVVVVDYTVPYDNYHSHRGLMWALNYAKVPAPGPTGRWDRTRDYIGYQPADRANPVRLSETPLGSADLLVLADAYGVYQMDLEILAGTRVQPTRSPQLFGGISHEDIDALEEFVGAGRDLLVEFNSLPPPTGPDERARMEELLGVKWTGWVGRVFPDLHDITDVPDWFEPFFEEHFPGRPLPTDPSLVMFSYEGELIVVSHPDYGHIAPRVRFTPAAADRLGDLRADAPLYKWFALVDPGPQALELAELLLPELVLTSEEFHEAGLHLSYPALTEFVVGRSHRFSMPIDGGNIPFDPGRYTVAGVHRGQALLNRRRDTLALEPVFWQFYVPVMLKILRD